MSFRLADRRMMRRWPLQCRATVHHHQRLADTRPQLRDRGALAHAIHGRWVAPPNRGRRRWAMDELVTSCGDDHSAIADLDAMSHGELSRAFLLCSELEHLDVLLSDLWPGHHAPIL